jgi:hypothetical protein
MRRLSFRLLAFRLFIAAAAFALGVASAGIRLTPRPAQAPTPAATAPTLSPGVCPSAEYLAVADDMRVEDRYYNYDYGFSVDLPAHMVGARSPAPAPNHGFGVDLDNPQSTLWTNSDDFPVSYLYVDASYNSPEGESLDDAIKEHLGFIAEEGSNVSVLSRTKTRLAGLRAERVVARYEKGGEAMMSDEVVAFREENGEYVVYTIDLSTPLSNYDRDKPVLEEMQKTWRLQPLP